ncbi:MAG: porin [Rhodocyclales bacterium]|nr:porin [Rhodocyclales bacterium]
MQRKLIVLAIAGLSGTALAQSNVSIYGTLHGNFDVINISGGTGAAATNTPSFNRVTSTSSLLGFKGKEKLDADLSALFQFEVSMNLDAGEGNSLFGAARNTFVGLDSSNWGRVQLGNFEGPTRAFESAIDISVNGYGPGTNGGIDSARAVVGKMGGLLAGSAGSIAVREKPSPTRSASKASPFDIYYANAVSWTSPKFSGFQAVALYSANENKDELAATKINTSLYDLGLSYDNGPLLLSLTNASIRLRNQDDGTSPIPPATKTSSQRWGDNFRTTETRLGGRYKFAAASIGFLWTHNRTKADANTLAGRVAGTNGLDLKQTVWGINGTYNVTSNGRLVGQYFQARDITGRLGDGSNSLSDTGATFYTFGYEHSLSKRTLLRAVYARVENDSNAGSWNGGYDFGNSGTGFAGPDRTISGLQMGLRHTF